VCLGTAALALGELGFVRDGRREFSDFVYDRRWLTHADRFEVSPDLPLREGHFTRRAPSAHDSAFHFALADTQPDAWGERVIRRAHAKRRGHDRTLGELTSFDLLAAVDDYSRVGALRLRNGRGEFLGSGADFRTPQLVDLEQIFSSTRAVERGTESEDDLAYLRGKATSLGGLRPKCTVLEEDGCLAIGKFPSLHDTRSVVRGEVLALKLAERAGLNSAAARVVLMENTPVAVVRRFDRTADGARVPYLSGGSLLQARRDEDRAYTEIADALRRVCANPVADVRLLWCRLVFNLLIGNVDDHLWNMGILHVGGGQWRLAEAFDLNPFPDRQLESKTWLSEESGPITSLAQLLDSADYFGLTRADAETNAARIASEVAQWREVATSREVGLQEAELQEFAPAFEHEEARAARALAT
jgi:serine/threonine-protein kinase HipA